MERVGGRKFYLSIPSLVWYDEKEKEHEYIILLNVTLNLLYQLSNVARISLQRDWMNSPYSSTSPSNVPNIGLVFLYALN